MANDAALFLLDSDSELMAATPEGNVLPRLGSPLPTAAPATHERDWPLTRVRILGLAILAAVALIARLSALDASGFSEDEIDKLYSAQAYLRGDFTGDGEHPALMKLAVAASLTSIDTWNRTAAGRHLGPIDRETAVRLPNAVAGGLIAVLLFLLAELFFSPIAALAAAWLWAFNINAIAMNRVAKEDTFVLLCFLAAALCFERGKRLGQSSPHLAQRWYAAAGAMFGLMIASKYVPFLFGYHVLYFRFAEPHPGPNRPDKTRYFGAMAAAFLIANFPVLLPANWQTIAGFVSARAPHHAGYVFQGSIWPNAMSATPAGLPVWFYAAQFLTKIPEPVLAAAAIGLWQLWRTRRDRGAIFVGALLVLIVVPYSLAGTKFLRYMLPAFALIDLAAAVGVAWLIEQARVSRRSRQAAASLLVSAIVVGPVIIWTTYPLSSLYRNGIGAAISPHALWFPPDELYDAGVREAVSEIAETAPAEQRVFTEAVASAAFYAKEYGRPDLRFERIAAADRHGWLMIQDGRIYFDNIATIREARRRPPSVVVTVQGFRAVEIYRAW